MNLSVSSMAHRPWKQVGLNILIIFIFISALRTDNSYGKGSVVYQNCFVYIALESSENHAVNILK
jgi:hypothetical protein